MRNGAIIFHWPYIQISFFLVALKKAVWFGRGRRSTWCWCTWSQPLCLQRRRAWPTRRAKGDGRPSGFPGTWFFLIVYCSWFLHIILYSIQFRVIFYNVWGRGKVGEMGLRRFVCLGIVLVCWCRVVVRLFFVCVHFCLLVCCAVPRWGHVENCLDCFVAARRLICWYFVEEIDGWFYGVSSSIYVSSITHLLFLSQGFELVMFKRLMAHSESLWWLFCWLFCWAMLLLFTPLWTVLGELDFSEHCW